MRFVIVVLSLSFSYCVNAQDMSPLAEYRWKNRLVLLFSSQTDDQLYQKQYDLLRADQSGLDERDLLIFNVLSHEITYDTDSVRIERAARLREHYRVDEKNFSILLIGKDGSEKMRSDAVVPRNELYAIIDAMPMRREEMRRN